MLSTRNISENVFLIKGERNASFPFCNSYLIQEKNDLIVVDPQCGAARLTDGIASIGCSLEDITAILNTHFHIDHSTASNRLSSKYNIPVYMHEYDAPMITSWDNMYSQYMIRTSEHKRIFYEMFHDTGGFSPFHVSNTFKCNDTLPLGIRAIHSPGHTPGHCCFEYNGILFSGDIELNVPWVGNASSSVGDFMKTINRLSEMEFKCILPGHGDPCYGEIKETFRQYYKKLTEHEESIYRILTQTPKPMDKILPFIKKFLPPSFRKKFNGRENPLPDHFENIANFQYLKHMESVGTVESTCMPDRQIMWSKQTPTERKQPIGRQGSAH